MAGELSRGGAVSDAAASLGLRASHADRDRVVDVLRVAAGDGRLTAEELDERLEAALSARTVGELAVLTTDLPTGAARTPVEAKDVARIRQRGGSARRGEGWVVPRRLKIESEWGDVTLDLSDAVIVYDTLRIDLDMRGGVLKLLTRPGIVVDTDGLELGFAKVKARSAGAPGVPVELRVEIHGRKDFGRVVVRPQRRVSVRRGPTP